MESKEKEKRKKPIKISRGGPPVRIRQRKQTKWGNDYNVWDIYWTEKGKRLSTSRTSYDEANALAVEIATRLAKGEIRQRILSGHELWEYEEATSVCKASGGTLTDAVRIMKYFNPNKTNKSVAEVRDLFLTSKERRENRTKESLKSDTDFLAKAFPESLLIELTVEELTDWLTGVRLTSGSIAFKCL